MKKTLSAWLGAMSLAFVFFAPQVQAGMIATDAAVQNAERARLSTLLERPEVAQQLEKMGISAADAKDRVAAMTDAEVASVSGQVDRLVAAGAMSNTDLIIILLIVLLILIAL